MVYGVVRNDAAKRKEPIFWVFEFPVGVAVGGSISPFHGEVSDIPG